LADTPGLVPGPRLWLVRVPGSDVGRHAVLMLDPAERDRARSFRDRADQQRFLVAHLCLRLILARHLDVRPEAVAFSRDRCPRCGQAHGRPVLAGPGQHVQFSMSHSGDWVLIGTGPWRLGVDIQEVPGLATVRDVLPLLHPGEQAEITARAGSGRARAFARVWARKEAYLKALGVGLAADLAQVYAGADGRAPGPAGWTILDVPVDMAYAAGLAVPGTVRRAELVTCQLPGRGVPALEVTARRRIA